MYEIGKLIRNRRMQLNLSQQQLADLMGYQSRSTIAKIEKGENDIPRSKIETFAKVLSTTPEYLMGWVDDPNDYEEIANDEGYSIPDDFYPELDQEDRLKKYYEFKRAEEQDHYRETEDSIQFTSVDEAMLFIIQNPTVAAYGGYDIEHMSDEEKIEFANQIADTIKFFGQKYKK